MASSHFGLQPAARPSLLGNRFLGAFDRSDRMRPELQEVEVDGTSMDLGLKDEHVEEIYAAIERNRVLVIVAPTGAGKSTVIPYRLLTPTAASGLAANHFTPQGRKIVVTQPRRDAASSIPSTIATKMHGSSVGPGSEIGFRHGQDRGQTDPWNRMVFVTDGTLVNWLIDQRAHEFSFVIVDEAHERSATIDFILGLMRDELLRHSHLRLIILSATIHAEAFEAFFEEVLPGEVWSKDFAECQKSHGYEVVWPPPGPAVDPSKMIAEVSRKILELLNGTTDGEVLAFLPGEPEIREAVELLKNGLSDELKQTTVIEPYYGTLLEKDRSRVKNPVIADKHGRVRRRVVIATNLAETSLTMPAVAHVIDSGLIKQSAWDPISRTESLRPRWHSQAGCRQRWGRAGRNRPGTVYPLYTQAQFDEFEPHTKPAVARECLDEILIKAKRAGIGALDAFPWLDAPPEVELARVTSLAAVRGFVDADLDLTERGSEIFDLYQRISPLVGEGAGAAARGLAMASLLALSDRFGCLIEAASLLIMMPLLGERLYARSGQTRGSLCFDRGVLLFDEAWPLEQLDEVGRIHESLKAGCVDDLDFGLKLLALAEGVTHEGQIYGGEEWAARSFVKIELLQKAIVDRNAIVAVFNRKAHDIRKLDFALFNRLRLMVGIAWPDFVRRLPGGGVWEDDRSKDTGPISIHSVCHGAQGDAVIAAFGRRAMDDDGAYVKAPVGSVVIRVDDRLAHLDDIALTGRVRALRLHAEEAWSRLLADIITPVSDRVDGDPEGKVYRWQTGADGRPRVQTTNTKRLRSLDVKPQQVLDLTVIRAIQFSPNGRAIGVVGMVNGLMAMLKGDDLAFGGPPPPAMLEPGSKYKVTVVDCSVSTPVLSVLPLVEEEWNRLAKRGEGKGEVTDLLPRRAGSFLVRIATPVSRCPGLYHSACATLSKDMSNLVATMTVGTQVAFQIIPPELDEVDLDISGDASDEGADDELDAFDALTEFGVEIQGGSLRSKPPLSVRDLYAAIKKAPNTERTLRRLFWKSHELIARPETVETEASAARAQELQLIAESLWHDAWGVDPEVVKSRSRKFKSSIDDEALSGSSKGLLQDVAAQALAIAIARSDVALEAARAMDKRSWVARDSQRVARRAAEIEMAIANYTEDMRRATSPTHIASLKAKIEAEQLKLKLFRAEGVDQERRWAEALGEADRLDASVAAKKLMLERLRNGNPIRRI